MNVLSLFDGISCGMVALERAGIKVDKYYASEIEPNAIKISEKNYPNIIRLGDVTKWKDWDIEWENIDLLIGGSPCQGFSFAGKQLNFEDPRSKLFFEFVGILNHIKKFNPNVKFLLENVVMKKEYQNVISKNLDCSPIMINSSLVSAQERKRLYWCNFNVQQPYDKNIFLENIIDYSCEKFLSDNTASRFRSIKNIRHLSEKSKCLLSSMWKGSQSNGMTNVVVDGKIRCINPLECERLQTLPDGYTDCVSNTQRYKALGNGWTVDVIAHILSCIKL